MFTLPTSIKDWADIIHGLIQSAAIVGGGAVALYEYRRFRKYSPKIEFDVDFELHPVSGDSAAGLVDIAVRIKNMSQVRNYFPTIKVGVKGLRTEDVQRALETGRRITFGNELIPKDNIVAKPEDPWWVDGGVTQVFPYPVVVKKTPDILQVNAEFYYYKDREAKEKIGYHQASRIKPTGKSTD
jgi:hypothetical protein